MKEIYAWVPWFQELARKIAEGGEKNLIERAKQIDWAGKNPALLKYGDRNIDPFSFLYFLAQKNTANQQRAVYTSTSKVFGIDSQELFSEKSQEVGFIFPTPIPSALVLFHDDSKGNPDVLWKLFRQAVQGSNAINADDFANVLKIKNVAVAKLTQTLFLVNPKQFMPIDKWTLKFNDALDFPPFSEAEKQIKDTDNGLKNYQSILEKFRSTFPGCTFYEINTVLYMMWQWSNDNTNIGEKIFQVSTNCVW